MIWEDQKTHLENGVEMAKKISSIIVGDKEYFKYLIVWEDIVGDSSITEIK